MRIQFDIGPVAAFVFRIGDESFSYNECYRFAEIAFMPASIEHVVFRTPDGRFAEVFVAAADDQVDNPHGYSRGWYAAQFIEPSEAAKVRESWAILREQPPLPPNY